MEMRLSRGPMEGVEEKGIAGGKGKMRGFTSRKEKKVANGVTLRMEFEWRPDRENKSTINTADNKSPSTL